MEKKNKQVNDYARYTSVAVEMLVIILGGIVAGVKLDQWLHLTFPIFTLVFSLASVSLAIYVVIKNLFKKE